MLRQTVTASEAQKRYRQEHFARTKGRDLYHENTTCKCTGKRNVDNIEGGATNNIQLPLPEHSFIPRKCRLRFHIVITSVHASPVRPRYAF